MTSPSKSSVVEDARSFLFVPGNRPDRFAKACASGADLVILDLEDAVPPKDKEASRSAVVQWAVDHPRCLVRVNGVGTAWSADDLRALQGSSVPVMLPKAERVDDIRMVREELQGSAIIGLVETPLGVEVARTLADCGLLVRLALGNVDLAAALGVDPASRAAMHYARGALVMASAAAGLAAPVDGVSTQLDDDVALADDAAHGRELGFAAKLCVHPRQVPLVNAAMSPSAEEIEWARRVLTSNADGVSVVDGAMVDAPVVQRAHSIVTRSERD